MEIPDLWCGEYCDGCNEFGEVCENCLEKYPMLENHDDEYNPNPTKLNDANSLFAQILRTRHGPQYSSQETRSSDQASRIRSSATHAKSLPKRLILPLARKGHPEAQLLATQCLQQGIGTPKNLKQAVFWFEKAALQQNSYAITQLGYVPEFQNPQKILVGKVMLLSELKKEKEKKMM